MAQKLTPEIITAAIAGFEAQKTFIDTQIAELRSMLDGRGTESTVTPSANGKPRKKFSLAARKKMAAAQKARWAGIKKAEASQPAAAAETPKPKKKRKLSVAGRKAISLAAKKRWKAIKAAKKAA
jgi:hypothetical protein